MKQGWKFTVGGLSLTAIILAGAIAQTNSWKNFKLRSVASAVLVSNRTQQTLDQTLGFEKRREDSAKARINLTELLSGGVGQDGIPSIDTPAFDTAETTPFASDDVVIGVVINGEAKAYPFRVMDWHEIVNDTVGGINISVSYCPLCDTIVAFERGETTFGVSGKLYQSCLVMYDRADDTLYAQPWAAGIMGEKVNENLARIPAVKTTLGSWLARHPESEILSTRTGHSRNYAEYPYGTYYTDENILFPVRNQETRQLHPKAIVSYIWEADGETPKNEFAGAHLQFVHEELKEQAPQIVELAGRSIRVRWDEHLETVITEEMDGTVIPSSTAFAFVYAAHFGDE